MSDENTETAAPTITSPEDFEVEAFSILAGAQSYDEGVNALNQLYTSAAPDLAGVRDITSKYGNDLRFKFKEPGFDISDTIEIAPVKIDQAVGETNVDIVSDWEQKNIEAVQNSADPDHIIAQERIVQSIRNLASEARRDELSGGNREGLLAWTSDKFYRGAEGVVGPFARLFGYDGLDKDLYERTQRSRDNTIASQVASGLGSAIPIVVGSFAGPGGALAVIGAQSSGEVRNIYEQAIENTGDESRADAAAATMLAGQAVGLAPIARSVSGAVGAFKNRALSETGEIVAKRSINDAIVAGLQAQKTKWGNVALSTFEAGVGGGAGQVLGNIANNISLDANGDVTHGAIEAFFANAIVGGVFSGAQALMDNTVIEQTKRIFQENKDNGALTEPQIVQGKTVEKPLYYKDEQGFIRPTDETLPDTEQRIAQKENFDRRVDEYVNDITPEDPDAFYSPEGEKFEMPVYEDYESDSIPAKTVVLGDPDYVPAPPPQVSDKPAWQKTYAEIKAEQDPSKSKHRHPTLHKEARDIVNQKWITPEEGEGTKESFERVVKAFNKKYGTRAFVRDKKNITGDVLDKGERGAAATSYDLGSFRYVIDVDFDAIKDYSPYQKKLLIRHEIEHVLDMETRKFKPTAGNYKKGHHQFYENFDIQYPHRAIIKEAIKRGETIPDAVLDDYPDLRDPAVIERIKNEKPPRKPRQKKKRFTTEELLGRADRAPDVIESYDDGVRPDTTDSFVGTVPTRFKPGVFAHFLARQLSAHMELSRNIADGAFGSYGTGNKKIKVLRSLGADPAKFKSTIAHEIGHFVDGYLNKAFEPGNEMQSIADKLGDMHNLLRKMVITEDIKEISQKWRPGWDGSPGDSASPDPAQRFAAYRNGADELYADLFSALINAPDFIQKSYPRVWEQFEASVARDPKLNELWNQFQKFEADPESLVRFQWDLRKQSRMKPGQIVNAVRLNEIEQNRPARRLKNSVNQAQEVFLNKYTKMKRSAKNASGEAREILFDNYINTKRKDYVYNFIQRAIEAPMEKLLTKFFQTKIEPNHWAQFESDNKLINETTPTIERVKQAPLQYALAATEIYKFLSTQKGVKPSILNDAFSVLTKRTPDEIANLNTTTLANELTEAFAKLGIVGDAAQILSMQDFVGKYSPKDPNRAKKATRDYRLAVHNLNRRKQSVPIEALKKWAETYSGNKLTKAAIQDVTQDGAFSVRRFLVNEGGYSIDDARQSMRVLEKDLGPERFKALKDVSEEFHQILAAPFEIMEKSQMFPPDLIERIRLNQGSYVTNSVLKYFEGDNSISSSMRTAIGSLSEVGNELTASLLKTKVIAERAYYQNAVNSAINTALYDGLVKEIIPARYGQDIFALRDKLSKGDKEHSYLIKYEQGRPSIAKIEGGKSYENMFKSIRDLPGMNTVLELADMFNKALLTRQFKTALSPAFVVFQKFYDRRLEAILANSLEITGGLPIHTSKALRSIDAATKAEIKHYNETGELTGKLKELLDFDGAALSQSLLHEEGNVDGFNSVDALYEMFGQKMPDEDSTLEKIGLFTEKVFDKVGGKFLKQVAEFDELRTKVNGFRIGKELLGMGDAEAATLAQERFGIPDPLGGGTAAPLINRAFLFGRAHLGGLRTLGSLIGDTPRTAAMQAAWRIIGPKLMVSGAVAGFVMRQALGDEAGEKWEKLLAMIPTNEKISKNVIPLGFQDGKGNYHNFSDVKASDIGTDWKAWYVRMPQSRELTAMTKVLWPFIENLYQGDVAAAVGQSTKAGGGVAMASVQPPIQYLINLAQLTMGDNPTDFYRMKGILDKDVVAAGSVGRKLYDYSKYVGGQQYSSLVPYNPFATKEPVGPLETVIQKFPLVGPMTRSMVGVSNYGLIEGDKAGKGLAQRVDAGIRLSTGEKTQEVLSEYSTVAAQISSLGKGWEAKVGATRAREMQAMTGWHARVWVPFRNELRAAQEKGDSERYAYLIEQLEKSSASLRRSLKREE